jgi:hypothetical protein
MDGPGSGTCLTYDLVQQQASAISNAAPCSSVTRVLIRKKINIRWNTSQEKDSRLHLYNAIQIFTNRLYVTVRKKLQRVQWNNRILKRFIKKKGLQRMMVLRMISRKVLTCKRTTRPKTKMLMIRAQMGETKMHTEFWQRNPFKSGH